MPPLVGRTIGSYRIDARVGAGGMGEVYRAHDTRLERAVALKLPPLAVAHDADRLRRFHAEARAVSSLNHPTILVIHDFGVLDDMPFIVTEFVEGDTLRQRLAHGALAVSDALDIAVQLAGALAAAHARGIVHRDVKPENVMLRPDGYVKLLDFGLAKLADPPSRSRPCRRGHATPPRSGSRRRRRQDLRRTRAHLPGVRARRRVMGGAPSRAREIDPAVETGIMHTYFLLHRYEDALAASEGLKADVVPASLVELGRADEARALIAELEARSGNRVPGLANAVRAFIDGRHDEGVCALIAQTRTMAVPDPEMLFYAGRHLARVGEADEAMPLIRRAFEGGYFCYPVFAEDPWLESLRAQPAFQEVLKAVRLQSERAADIFVEAGGVHLLGLDSRAR